MRSDATQFALEAPATLDAVLAQLAAEPGKHTLIAGGTEIMVALGVGRLAQRSLISIQHLREMRFIRVEQDAIHIGSGSTFTDIRNSAQIATDLPLLVQSASWTGSVATQNRGTLGGNICNASPAADTPPALLAYGATVTLISTSGVRTIPYAEFHLGYKKPLFAPTNSSTALPFREPSTAIATTFARSVRATRRLSRKSLSPLWHAWTAT